MNLEEMKKYMKFGMEVSIDMVRPEMDELTKLQFSSNGFSIVPAGEASVVITDDKAIAEKHHKGGKRVVIQLLDIPPAVREVADIPVSDRFALFDTDQKGFGAFSEAIDFLRRSPHTTGSEKFDGTTP